MVISPASDGSAPHSLPTCCTPVSGKTPGEFFTRADDLASYLPFLELRLDSLDSPTEAAAHLPALRRAHPKTVLLATCRTVLSGGRFQGQPADELQVLLAATAAGCQIVDLAIESAEALGDEALRLLRAAGARVMLSFHDFEATRDLETTLNRLRRFTPDLVKLVSTAQSLEDSLTLLQWLRSASGTLPFPVVGIAMGEDGLLTRVLGPICGGAFTFGAASEAEATAPGQLTTESLTGLYRLDRHTPATRLFGVAGDPIRSSLSPLMLNTAFAHAGLDAVDVPLRTADPAMLLRAADGLALSGCSVTMPLKQTLLPLLERVDPLAIRIGAVNTLVRSPDGALHGYNTDAAGIVTPLEQRLALRGARVLVLGAGGAARAAVFGCLDRGARVSIVNRTASAAEQLALEAGAEALDRECLTQRDFDVVIQTTPAGMRGNPAGLPLRSTELRAGLVFDLVYNPLETPLLALARGMGIAVIPGVEMFLHQGARQFELWTGLRAPLDAMRDAVLGHLRAFDPQNGNHASGVFAG